MRSWVSSPDFKGNSCWTSPGWSGHRTPMARRDAKALPQASQLTLVFFGSRITSRPLRQQTQRASMSRQHADVRASWVRPATRGVS